MAARYGTTDGVLKPLPEISLPDPRWELLGKLTAEGFKRNEVVDLHAWMSRHVLNGSVPKEICRQFDLARNLMLYSWFVFEFHVIAELQAYAALEFALRTRFPKASAKPAKSGKASGNRPETLSPLLQRAIKSGAIVPKHLPAWKQAVAHWNKLSAEDFVPDGKLGTPADWFDAVATSLPKLRNRLAHGNPQLYLTGSLQAVALCSDLINALFPETESASPPQSTPIATS